MSNYALIIFILAALGGVLMATRIFQGQLPSWTISRGHAVAGVIGLIMLLILVVNGAASARITQALVVLSIAAVGGFFLASFHGRKIVAPKAIVIGHGLAAIAGILLLASTVF